MNIESEIEALKARVEYLESLLKQNSQEPQKEGRDKTRYYYNGRVYPKNRLVLAIVKDYISKHNPNHDALCEAFDKSLQGSLGVFAKLSEAIKLKDGAKRYFLNDIIKLCDGTEVVVCTQWGIFNIVKFVKQARNLGYPIEEFVMATLF